MLALLPHSCNDTGCTSVQMSCFKEYSQGFLCPLGGSGKVWGLECTLQMNEGVIMHVQTISLLYFNLSVSVKETEVRKSLKKSSK